VNVLNCRDQRGLRGLPGPVVAPFDRVLGWGA